MSSGSSTAVRRLHLIKHLKNIRAAREKEQELGLKELVQLAAGDSNRSLAPVRVAGQNLFEAREYIVRQAVKGLRDVGTPDPDSVLVPAYSQQQVAARGSRDGQAWLPDDFGKKVAQEALREFQLPPFENTFLALCWVDGSYSRHANNQLFASLGSTVLHLLLRTLCLSLPTAAPLEALGDHNLSKVFRGFRTSQYLLTSMEVASDLEGHCYYGTALGKAAVRHYADGADDDGEDEERERRKQVKIACYATALKALVGSVYLEHGLDAATLFVNSHVWPRLTLILDGSIK